ncbi:MAG: glycoside hydrolase family 24 [Robiginitomaculum sp.]|nr:MAG: glycoside hydrolase family 24 [Robiginitomaculum sp.]
MSAFHEIQFPISISFRSVGGPERRTEIVTLESGYEERNTPWKHARRRYDAAIGIRSLVDIESVVSFFEARSGRLHGFRWKDPVDHQSSAVGTPPSATDQLLGLGDGVQTVFQLSKIYEPGTNKYIRIITKPVTGSLQMAVAGSIKAEGTDFSIDNQTGQITFLAGSEPGAGLAVTAGFQFDVPVRFDTDYLAISVEAFQSGSIGSIPIMEIR